MKKPELYDHIWDDDLMQLYERQMDDFNKSQHAEYKPLRSSPMAGLKDACLMIMGIPVMLVMFIVMWVINLIPLLLACLFVLWLAHKFFA